ncbi:hypothetical protein LSH36_153g04090 [Paralvinella palmiformis]|uniref:PLAT domain-containing protein n=1 Tax=Paralvinella palmiformis TaxID=53620 RepID=A0AAD9JUM7_9ANNE|nr:hypothetical protein LSH36_153g04090 [Paralvinella palmiformis]
MESAREWSGEGLLASSDIQTVVVVTHVDTTPVTRPLVTVKAGLPPEPNVHLMKWEYPLDENNITISLNPNVLNEGVTYYIGLVDALYNEGRRRPGEIWERKYQLKLWWGQCLYWNHVANSWSPDGCILRPTSSYYRAHCSCSHLSSFGAHLSLAPNDLDFTNVEDFFDLHENPVTFSLITSIIIVYIVLLIICVRKDRHDEKKNTVVHLIDNNTNDKQVYVVTLETGFRKGAGTTAKVSLVLHGEEGMSETRELTSENQQPLFERNSRDTFILTFSESLGHIFKVQIWHNNAGSSPSWYLSRVTVWDVNTGHMYYFICEKWFAVEEEDEKVEREIMVSDHGLGFTKVALAKGSQYFADHHIWFSPLTRPSYSPFTRAQRLTCCLCLLLSYMAVNAAWYKSQEREYRGEFGLIDISWRSVVVGIITALIVLPPNMIIILLFRKSKVSMTVGRDIVDTDDNGRDDVYKDSHKRDSMSSVSSQAHIQQVLQTSIFDQTLINWQSLQDWAQKTWAKHQSEFGAVASSSEFRPLEAEDDLDIMPDKLPTRSPGGSSGSEWSPGGSTRSQAPNSAAEESSSDSHKSYASATKTPSDSGSNPTPIPPTANNQARLKPRPPASLTSPVQPPSKPIELGHNSQHGSPKSDRSTSASNVTYTTTSSEKSSEKSSQHYVRSQWSVSKSDCSGMHLSRIQYSRRKRCYLPEGCRYFAWILCALVIAGCASITILYGFRFGRTKSIQWLQSLFFSFLQCVFITHPILIFFVSLIVGLRYRNDLSIFNCLDSDLIYKEVKAELKSHEKLKEEEDDCDFQKGVAARQRSRYLRFTRPPQEKQLIEARMKGIKERKASAILSGTAEFVIKFILLMFMAFGKDLRPVYQLNEAFKVSIVKSGLPSFESIRSVPEWWNWTQTHFLDSVYWERWYNGQLTQFDRDYIANSILIGHINLRQLRIDEQPCHIQSPYSHITTRCRYEYGPDSKSHMAFGHNTTWWHMRSDSTGANGVSGKHSYYDGDGFLVLLSKERGQALSQLRYLEADEWIDHFTRAIITEFMLFHPQSNLFTSIKLLIETPASGGISTTSYISSAHLYKYITPLDNFVLACELLFIAVTFFKLYHITVQFLHNREEYLRNPWHWCVITQGLLSLAYIVCYVYRFILVADTVERLRATYHEIYVDISHVVQWDHLMFVIWLSAYSCLGVALYASISPLYCEPDRALVATTGLFTRHYGLADIDINDFWSILGFRFVVASFMVFAIGSLTAYVSRQKLIQYLDLQGCVSVFLRALQHSMTSLAVIGNDIFSTSSDVKRGGSTSCNSFTASVGPTIDAVRSCCPDSWLGDTDSLLLMDGTVIPA